MFFFPADVHSWRGVSTTGRHGEQPMTGALLCHMPPAVAINPVLTLRCYDRRVRAASYTDPQERV